MNGGVVSERFYLFYAYSTTTCSFISNSFLIFAIIVTKINHVGPYRWLLLSFAIVDILISTVHTIMIPALHMTEFGYICWGYGFLHKSTAVGFWGSLFFLRPTEAARGVFAPILKEASSQEVYGIDLYAPNMPGFLAIAYWTQVFSSCFKVSLSASLLYCGSICVAGGIGLYPTEASRRVFAPVLKNIYDIDLYAPNLPGYLAITYWLPLDNGRKEFQVTPIVSMVCVFSLIFSSIVVILVCLIRMLREMRKMRIHLESSARQMHRQLLRALIWQTLIPICTSYLPFGIFLTSPLFSGVPLGEKGTLVLLSLQLFPFIDPLIILYFVQGFRISLPRFVRFAMVGPFAQSAAAVSNTTITTTRSIRQTNA